MFLRKVNQMSTKFVIAIGGIATIGVVGVLLPLIMRKKHFCIREGIKCPNAPHNDSMECCQECCHINDN